MSVDGRVGFGPRRGRQGWQGVLCLVLGGVTLAPQAARVGAGGWQAANPLAVLGAGLLLALGAATLLALARGRPRLEADGHGLVLHGLLRTRRAAWGTIGAFALVPVARGRFGRPRFQAVAPWPGAGRGGFVVPDAFEVPLAQVLEAAGALRPGTDGVAAEVAVQRPWGVAGFRWPWLTAAMLAVLAGVFVLERQVGGGLGAVPGAPGDPSLQTLVAMGGVSRALVESGEWYRLLTAALLHASAVHLLANGVAFALAGYALERLVGRAWMFCVFSVGALGGSLASIALNPPAMVSVGASGAIMAMLAALLLLSVRMPAGRARTSIQVQAARTAIPALVPLGHGASGLHVDYGAHLGGAVIGGVLGLLLLLSWRDHLPLPGRRAAATGLAVLCAVAFAGSAAAVALGFQARATAAAELIPDGQIPRDAAGIAANADRLLAAYPRDPRSHLLVATQRMRRGDLPGTLMELRVALPLVAAHPFGLPPPLANIIRATTAMALYADGKKAEAATAAGPACTPAPGEAVSPHLADGLVQFGLCPKPAAVPASPG